MDELRNALEEAVALIETGENRAMATDGPVPHFRGELDDREWRRLWVALGKVRAALATADKPLTDALQRLATVARRGEVMAAESNYVGAWAALAGALVDELRTADKPLTGRDYLNELVHLGHCNFGEWPGQCKYGPAAECPALTEWGWLPAAYAATPTAPALDVELRGMLAKVFADHDAMGCCDPKTTEHVWRSIEFVLGSAHEQGYVAALSDALLRLGHHSISKHLLPEQYDSESGLACAIPTCLAALSPTTETPE